MRLTFHNNVFHLYLPEKKASFMKSRPAYRNFEQTFHLLLKKAQKEAVSIQTLLTIMSGKGKILLLLFLSLGFSQIPIIAVPLGLFISYLGLRNALGSSFVWCPKFLRRKKISSYLLTKVIHQILQMLTFIKRWSKPRFQWPQKRGAHIISGLVIALVGLCISLAPPIPLTGMLASLGIFFIAIGFLNSDGLYILLGYVAAFLYVIMAICLFYYCPMTKIFAWVKNLIF